MSSVTVAFTQESLIGYNTQDSNPGPPRLFTEPVLQNSAVFDVRRLSCRGSISLLLTWLGGGCRWGSMASATSMWKAVSVR